MNKRRNARKKICLILVLLLTVCALPGAAETSPDTAQESTAEFAATTDATIEAITSQIDDLRAQLARLESDLAAQQSTVTGVWQHKQLLDQQIALLAAEVDCFGQLLDHYDVRIAEVSKESEALQTEYDADYQALVVRLRQSYEEGMPGLLEYFGRSDSLLSLLVGLERRNEIKEYDQALMEDLNAKRKAIADKSSELTTLRNDRYLVAAEQVARTQFLNTKLQEGGNFLLSLNDDLNRFSYYVQLSQAGVQTADRRIAEAIAMLEETVGTDALQAEIAEKRTQIGDSLQVKMDSGNLQKGAEYYADGVRYLWPLALNRDYKAEISASMGYRTYQVDGRVIADYHGGTDLGADYGTDVVASASGKVADAGYVEGYGYYVAIWHADGSVTRYAHLGAITVKVGDCVLQGEAIGSAGCSGNSTGVGCHFELWIDGSRVDPAEYLTLPTAIYPDAAE